MKKLLKKTKLYKKYKKPLKKTKLYKKHKKLKSKIKRFIHRIRQYYYLKIRLPQIYAKYSKAPLEHKAVFMELRVDKMSPSFKNIYDKLENDYDYDLHIHYLRTGFIKQKQQFLLAAEYIKDIATAEIIIVNEANNLLCSIELRKETKYAQLWHGCGAFKKFGFSTADLKFGGNRKTNNKYPMNTNYSFVTVSSPDVAWAYVEAMRLEKTPEIVKPVGISRTDVFFDKEYIDKAKQRLYEKIPEAKNKKVILYAPTFRGTVIGAKAPNELDVGAFAEAFSDEYILIFKHHPVVKKIPKIPEEYLNSFAFDMTNEMEIEDLIITSDLCISDYSSLIFEYSLLEKPLIFYAYDLDEYCDWRGFYYPYEELTPGPVVRTNEELIAYIKSIDYEFVEQKMIDFKEKFMRSCDGNSTDRIISMIVD